MSSMLENPAVLFGAFYDETSLRQKSLIAGKFSRGDVSFEEHRWIIQHADVSWQVYDKISLVSSVKRIIFCQIVFADIIERYTNHLDRLLTYTDLYRGGGNGGGGDWGGEKPEGAPASTPRSKLSKLLQI